MERNYDIFDRLRQLITHNDSDDEGSTPPNRRHLSRQEISVPNPATETHRGHVAIELSSLFGSPPATAASRRSPSPTGSTQGPHSFGFPLVQQQTRRRARSRRTQRSGSRFLRTVVLLPGPTILAKIMWDKLAKCTASTIDQFFTWKPTFFGPNPTFPPSPHAMLFVRKGLPTSRPTLHQGGRGERAKTAAIREKDTLSHTFWPGLSISRTFTTNAHNSKCMECTVSKFVWVKFVHVLHTRLTSRL